MLENNDENVEKIVDEKLVNQQKEVSEAVDEIEKSVAEKSENTPTNEEIELLDYNAMELSELNLELEKLLKKYPIQQIKDNVEAIKLAFNSQFGTLLAERKEAFLEEGGNSIDFHFSSPEKTTYNKLLGEYKKRRDAYYNKLEKELNDNLEKRQAIIEELKSVIEKADPKTMYNEYKVLNDRWKTIGAVPRDHYNDVWKVYHHHVERFYDLLHLNKDFRELDFKHNLEEKLKIIARAEELAEAKDVNIAFKELQDLHRIWKEEVGPVAREHREDVWQKFSEATKKLHDRRHEHFKELRGKVQELVEEKLKVVAEINAYDTSKNQAHKDWQKSIKKIEALRQKYFDLGKLPYSKSEEVWQKFKSATKKFNSAKNAFYKEEKRQQNENLKQKMALVELAESLKDSEEWESTINTMKRIQSDWKNIGHVPRKFSDEVWKRFKSACNHFFDRLNERNDEAHKEQNAVISKKKAYLDVFKVKEVVTLEEIQTAIAEWRDLGSLPRNARFLDGKFNKVIDNQLEKQNMSRSDIEMMKFKNVVDNYLSQEDYRKLDSEQLFIRRKIDENVRDMQQLENNLSFISNATEDNPLVKNVRKGIQEFKDELDILQLKLDYLRELDY